MNIPAAIWIRLSPTISAKESQMNETALSTILKPISQGAVRADIKFPK
jgi:hypothetical protein